jgi:hypothetical protein
MRRYAVLTIALFALVAAPARGSGGPIVGGDAGFTGVTVPGLGMRYVTQQVPGGTLVMAVNRRGGEILRSRFLRRPLTVPAVAFDGTATGLGADGRTLVLATPRVSLPSRRSDFVVLETERLRQVASFSLGGDFSLDAVSPDADLLYFIQLRSADGTRYAVRAYDLAKQRLLRKPVVDPAEADEPMRGSPLSRALSSDGRWAYTLYDGNGKAPFIHALDTAGARAKCVDLDVLAGRQDLFDLRLAMAGDGTVLVRDALGRPLLAVDPHTFAVNQPRPAEPASPPPAPDDGGGWLGPAAGLALLALLIAAALKVGGARATPRMR